MNDLNDVGRDPPNSAAERLAEMKRMYEELRAMIDIGLANFGKPQADMPAAILKKISDLQAAHLKVVIAEDAFNAQFGLNEDADTTDYDAVRADIGGQLDRIRDSRGSD